MSIDLAAPPALLRVDSRSLDTLQEERRTKRTNYDRLALSVRCLTLSPTVLGQATAQKPNPTRATPDPLSQFNPIVPAAAENAVASAPTKRSRKYSLPCPSRLTMR